MIVSTSKKSALSRRGAAVAMVTAAALMVFVAACGGSAGSSGSGSTSGTDDKAATTGSTRGSGRNNADFTATPVQLTLNPCTLVTKAEAEDVIGASVSQGLGANGHICTHTANGNGGIVSVEAVAPDFCKLLFSALDQNAFGGAQVRIDLAQGGMQVKGGGNVQVVVAGGCLTIDATKDGTKVDDATVLGLAETATDRVVAAGT